MRLDINIFSSTPTLRNTWSNPALHLAGFCPGATYNFKSKRTLSKKDLITNLHVNICFSFGNLENQGRYSYCFRRPSREVTTAVQPGRNELLLSPENVNGDLVAEAFEKRVIDESDCVHKIRAAGGPANGRGQQANAEGT